MVARGLQLASFLAPLLLAAPASAEEVYWTPKALLASFFPASERVTYVRVDARRAELAARLGYTPTKASYVVFVAKTGAHVDGFAVIDEELGQHEPITFGVKLSPSAAVERVEVLVYREAYGSEVREARFRRQFEGKVAGDSLRLGEDVVAISGATISAKALAAGVRRATTLAAFASVAGSAEGPGAAPAGAATTVAEATASSARPITR